jgi:hypothetical protein
VRTGSARCFRMGQEMKIPEMNTGMNTSIIVQYWTIPLDCPASIVQPLYGMGQRYSPTLTKVEGLDYRKLTAVWPAVLWTTLIQ